MLAKKQATQCQVWHNECANLGEYIKKVKNRLVCDLEVADFQVWYKRSSLFQGEWFKKQSLHQKVSYAAVRDFRSPKLGEGL